MIWNWIQGRWLLLLTAVSLLVPVVLWPVFVNRAEQEYEQQLATEQADTVSEVDLASRQIQAVLAAQAPILPTRPESVLFLTDEQGVIVRSSEATLVMAALPDAPVRALEPSVREARYKRQDFTRLDVQTLGPARGVWNDAGRVRQVIWVRSAVNDTLTAHVLHPLPDRESIAQKWRELYVSSAAAGMLTVMLIGSGLMFVAAVRARDVQLQALNTQLLALSRTDPLTGCANRRHFLERLDSELQRLQRQSQPLSLLSLDLDHFKRINDTHGHAAGDAVLRSVVQCLQSRLRSMDLLGRVGGEEFAVLLPATPSAAAQHVAESLRARVAECLTQFEGKTLHVTVSIGGTTLDNAHVDTSGPDGLALADAALYRAKAEGRNRVAWAQTSDGAGAPPQELAR